MRSRMQVVIFGVGSLGTLFGARLSHHANVLLVGHWPEQLAALRANPLSVLELDGSETSHRLAVTGSLDDVPPADAIFILTKASGTLQAAQGAARILKNDGIAVTLQNGLGNFDVLTRHVGERRAALGVTMQGASVPEPGVVRHGGNGPTYLALSGEAGERIGWVADLLRVSGFPMEIVDDVTGLVWGKLAVNCAINPLASLLRIQNGVLLESAWTREIMRAAAQEVEAVAGKLGIALPFEDAPAQAERVAEVTARNRSSMLQDALRGVETEIDVICGEVVRQAQALGITTPTLSMLYRMVRAMEDTNAARVVPR